MEGRNVVVAAAESENIHVAEGGEEATVHEVHEYE
jgi:hypothetical protein